MIAEAVKDSIPQTKSIAVDLATIRFTDKKTGDRYTYGTPYNAQEALVQFDAGQKPEPFKFRLQTLYQIRPKSNIPRRTPSKAPKSKVIIDDRTTKNSPSPAVAAPIKIGGRAAPKSILGHTRRFGRMIFPEALRENPPASQPSN